MRDETIVPPLLALGPLTLHALDAAHQSIAPEVVETIPPRHLHLESLLPLLTLLLKYGTRSIRRTGRFSLVKSRLG